MIIEHGREILEVVGLAIVVGSLIRGKKTKKAIKAAIVLLQTMSSAVEENGASEVKREIAKTVDVMRSEVPLLSEVQDLVLQRVDPKKHVPPIKRFWRRFLKGENLAGVAARIAGAAAVKRNTENIELWE